MWRFLSFSLLYLILLLAGIPRSKAEIYSPGTNLLFKGRLGWMKTEILIETGKNDPKALVHYPSKNKTYRLVLSRDGQRFEERSLFENKPTGISWEIAGTTGKKLYGARLQSGKKKRFVLASKKIIPDLGVINTLLQNAIPAESLFFTLCSQFTGIRYDILYFGGSMERAPKQLSSKVVRLRWERVNFFADEQPEILAELQISDYIHVVRILRNEGSLRSWVPQAIWFKRKHRDAQPCLTNPPGKGYFYGQPEPVMGPGQYVLTGYTYGGNCSFINRGDQIDFYVWSIHFEGIRELYQAPARAYWYASPDPSPIKEPEFREFDFVQQQGMYPLVLMKKEAIFKYPDGIIKGETMRPIDFRTRYINLFTGRY